jgi:hypothetical protein
MQSCTDAIVCNAVREMQCMRVPMEEHSANARMQHQCDPNVIPM